MFPTPFRVVVDANVLFPFTLRDTILRAAARGYFQIYWSEQILEEARRNLVATGSTSEEQAERLMATMRRALGYPSHLSVICLRLRDLMATRGGCSICSQSIRRVFTGPKTAPTSF